MPGLSLLPLLILAAPAGEPATADLLRQAEAAFQRGVASRAHVQAAQRHFSEAAALFEQVQQRGVQSPALYLNLGNAEYLAGRPEHAIWAFLGGLEGDPNDHRLRQHLESARKRIHYPPGGVGRPAADPWPTWLPRPTPSGMLGSAGLAYALACLTATAWARRRGRALLSATLVLTGLALASLLAFGACKSQVERDQAQPQVVVMEETSLYRGNGPSYPTYPDLPPLPRGAEARQVLRRGHWLQVRLATGEIGWLPAAMVRVVAVPFRA